MPQKVSLGIAGLDAVLTGGIPAGQATLVTGGPGVGKTVLASQIATHWALKEGPTLFVAFEESPDAILANTTGFAWSAAGLAGDTLHFLDAQPTTRAIFSGNFNLDGLMASLRVLIEDHGIRFAVFDGIDQLLDMLPSPLIRRRQFLHLLDMLGEWGLTALITVKARDGPRVPDYMFMQYAMQCVLRLENGGGQLRGRRSATVVKYRGSPTLPGLHPFVIDRWGFSVAGAVSLDDEAMPEPGERVSTGIGQLDALLSGGLFRGTATLVSGGPGTAKTSLAAGFLAAGAEKGETGLCVLFEESFERVAANAASLGIDLATPARDGLIHSLSLMPRTAQPEEIYLALLRMLDQTRPSRIVVDPLSALLRPGAADPDAERLLERLFRLLKSRRATVLVTSLVDPALPVGDQSLSGISAVADTWIELTNRGTRGERIRGLSIVKSRGTAHSSQLRELVLGDGGIALSGTPAGAAGAADAWHGNDPLPRLPDVKSIDARLARLQAEIRAIERDQALLRERAAEAVTGKPHDQ